LVTDALHTLESNSVNTQQPQEYYALMAVVFQKLGSITKPLPIISKHLVKVPARQFGILVWACLYRQRGARKKQNKLISKRSLASLARSLHSLYHND